jgi:signal peptidase II
MTSLAQRPILLGIPIIVFLLDRWTKVQVENSLLLYESRKVIPGVLDLTHTRNTGVAFGFFANSNSAWVPPLLTVISGFALLLILLYSFKHPATEWRLQLGLMLVLGGAAGNLHDRITYGYVIDFIDVYFQNFHWWTFNVADSAISVGIALLLWEVATERPESSNQRGASLNP